MATDAPHTVAASAPAGPSPLAASSDDDGPPLPKRATGRALPPLPPLPPVPAQRPASQGSDPTPAATTAGGAAALPPPPPATTTTTTTTTTTATPPPTLPTDLPPPPPANDDPQPMKKDSLSLPGTPSTTTTTTNNNNNNNNNNSGVSGKPRAISETVTTRPLSAASTNSSNDGGEAPHPRSIAGVEATMKREQRATSSPSLPSHLRKEKQRRGSRFNIFAKSAVNGSGGASGSRDEDESDYQLDKPLKQGTLWKLSGKKAQTHEVLMRFQKRFFVLTPVCLAYYKSEKSDDVLGVVRFKDVTRIGDSRNAKASKKDVGAFDITTASRTFTLYSSTIAESNEWRGSIVIAQREYSESHGDGGGPQPFTRASVAVGSTSPPSSGLNSSRLQALSVGTPVAGAAPSPMSWSPSPARTGGSAPHTQSARGGGGGGGGSDLPQRPPGPLPQLPKRPSGALVPLPPPPEPVSPEVAAARAALAQQRAAIVQKRVKVNAAEQRAWNAMRNVKSAVKSVERASRRISVQVGSAMSVEMSVRAAETELNNKEGKERQLEAAVTAEERAARDEGARADHAARDRENALTAAREREESVRERVREVRAQVEAMKRNEAVKASLVTQLSQLKGETQDLQQSCEEQLVEQEAMNEELSQNVVDFQLQKGVELETLARTVEWTRGLVETGADVSAEGLAALVGDPDALAAAETEARKKIEQIQADIKHARERIEEMKAEVAELKEERAAVAADVRRLERRVEAGAPRKAELSNKIDSEEEKVRRCEIEITEMTTAIELTEKREAAKRAELSRIQEDMSKQGDARIKAAERRTRLDDACIRADAALAAFASHVAIVRLRELLSVSDSELESPDKLGEVDAGVTSLMSQMAIIDAKLLETIHQLEEEANSMHNEDAAKAAASRMAARSGTGGKKLQGVAAIFRDESRASRVTSGNHQHLLSSIRRGTALRTPTKEEMERPAEEESSVWSSLKSEIGNFRKAVQADTDSEESSDWE